MTEEQNEFKDEFGQEPELSDDLPNQTDAQGQPMGRVRIPRGKEVMGKVDQRVGANRMIVMCFDGKKRNCRIPGRLKRALWIRSGNIVLVEPWEFEGDIKGDIIFNYTPAQISWLERKGFLKNTNNEF